MCHLSSKQLTGKDGSVADPEALSATSERQRYADKETWWTTKTDKMAFSPLF